MGELSARESNRLRHGHARHSAPDSPTYQSWQAMKTRCNNPRRHNANRYSGAGVSYDPRWESFDAFLSDMGKRPDGHSLDRIDPAGDYCPENCRWATPTAQARNRRNAKLDFDSAVQVATRRLRGESCKSIAADFGCSESLPREIVRGRTWKDALRMARAALGGSDG